MRGCLKLNEIILSQEQYDRFEFMFLDTIGFLLAQEFAKGAPVDTGNLRNSIRHEVRNGEVVILMSIHGLYVEYGTRPHVILPKNAKALSFKINGETVVTKKVNHPGTDPSPFVRPVLYNKFQSIAEKAKEIALIEVLSA